ncbi:putative membrane protein YccC [Mucilaginibacter sp. UYNi724]
MPPTFLLFLGFVCYLGFITLSLVICIPMLFIESVNLLAKKIILTVLISFPCLLMTGFVFTIVCVLPALLFTWLYNNKYIPTTVGIYATIASFLIFVGIVAICSLYLWYFASNLIYKRLDKKPLSDFLDNDKIYNYLKLFLIKLRIVNT